MVNENDLVEVEWTGKKLLLKKDKLDEWHSMANNEQRVDYMNSHPEFRHSGDPIMVHRMDNSKNRSLQEPDDLVLVHWSGTKVKNLHLQTTVNVKFVLSGSILNYLLLLPINRFCSWNVHNWMNGTLRVTKTMLTL
jgi:hypothetical protein